MNAKQQRKLAMYEVVQIVLNRHVSKWQNDEPFDQAVPVLDENVDLIKAAAPKQLRVTGGAQAKKQALQALGVVAYFVASQVYAYAAKTGNLELKAQVDYSQSEIIKGGQEVVVPRCRAIHTAATAELANLMKYKVNAAKLAELDAAIVAYDQKSSGPRDATTKSSAATKSLAALFRETDQLLKEQLDKLMAPYAATEPEFYNEYKSARVIVDIGGESEDEEPPTPPAPTP